jgi:hypothetical protein
VADFINTVMNLGFHKNVPVVDYLNVLSPSQ